MNLFNKEEHRACIARCVSKNYNSLLEGVDQFSLSYIELVLDWAKESTRNMVACANDYLCVLGHLDLDEPDDRMYDDSWYKGFLYDNYEQSLSMGSKLLTKYVLENEGDKSVLSFLWDRSKIMCQFADHVFGMDETPYSKMFDFMACLVKFFEYDTLGGFYER